MRLIIVNQNPLPSSDSESLQIINTVVALAKYAEIHLISCGGVHKAVGEYYNLNIPDKVHFHFLKGFKIDFFLLRITWNLPFYISSLIKLLSIHRVQKINALLVRNLKFGSFLLKLRRFFRLPPLFFETHEIFTLSFCDEMDIKKRKSEKLKKIYRRESYVYNNADGLICITRHLADMIKDRFSVECPLLVAPDGVNLAHFDNVNNSNEIDTHGIKPGRILLYIGSLHQWKGIDVLLEAMQYLPDVFLLIAGGNSKIIHFYRSVSERLGVKNRVRFEGFVLPHKRFEYYRVADICILPLKRVSIASYFTSPLKLFEYMASGKPIVASDLPAIREVLSHNINSILVLPDSPKALAEGILCLLENPTLRRRLAEQAAIDVCEYTWDKRAEKIINFIQSYKKTGCVE